MLGDRGIVDEADGGKFRLLRPNRTSAIRERAAGFFRERDERDKQSKKSTLYVAVANDSRWSYVLDSFGHEGGPSLRCDRCRFWNEGGARPSLGSLAAASSHC